MTPSPASTLPDTPCYLSGDFSTLRNAKSTSLLGAVFLRQISVDADELLLSSATKEILPITLLDGQPVDSGQPGNVFARLYAACQQAKQEPST